MGLLIFVVVVVMMVEFEDGGGRNLCNLRCLLLCKVIDNEKSCLKNIKSIIKLVLSYHFLLY
jgi:hypothetical protein